MDQPTAEEFRERAKAARERGHTRMAEIYKRRAHELELLTAMRVREVTKVITVRRRKYTVKFNYNEKGAWYANAHAQGSVFPDAYVSGYADLSSCLKAVRHKLKEL